ncbi:MAG: hypothetical protein K2N58_03390 [Treponemataceae bacterium]|nr:hypothetical protein [Treponemataceae bacterium]
MKKLFISFLVFITASLMFAETNIYSVIETFLEKGAYVKICRDDKNTWYLQRENIVFIEIDEDDIEFHNNSGKNEHSFNFKNWKFILDEKGNLIIKKHEK